MLADLPDEDSPASSMSGLKFDHGLEVIYMDLVLDEIQ
jgi:hypothetical protein